MTRVDNRSTLDVLIRNSYVYALSTTVQLDGMPLASRDQLVILAALVNVPEAATPETQFDVQLLADILVARQVMLFSLVQPENIL